MITWIQALDLLYFRHGRFEVANTSQSIGRMSPVYGGDAPFCCLTSVPQNTIEQSLKTLRNDILWALQHLNPEACWESTFSQINKGFWQESWLENAKPHSLTRYSPALPQPLR